MKKFIEMIAICLLFLLTGCKGGTPVDFQLDVGGNLYEAKTSVMADFNVHIANVAPVTFATYESSDFVTLSKAYAEPFEWLIENVQKPLVEQAGKDGEYDITVTGYISWHGLKFEVNEHWKSPDTIAQSTINEETETPFIYLPKEKRMYAKCDCKDDYKARFDYVGY